MQKGMHTWPNPQRHTFTQREGSMIIRSCSFTKRYINCNSDRRTQLISGCGRTGIMNLLLNRGHRPHIPSVRFGLQFLKTDRERCNGSAIIKRVAAHTSSRQLSWFCIKRNEITYAYPLRNFARAESNIYNEMLQPDHITTLALG